MAVHVSIHDVTPRWASVVDTLLEWCGNCGIRPALLVVPNYHGGWPLEKHPEFCEKLRALQDAGHEIYLHGFHHRALPRAEGQGALDRVRRKYHQRVVSNGEAEFGGIPLETARELLSQGREVLHSIGLKPTGFVAPAWSMSSALLPLLADHGYRFTEDHLRVYDPVRGVERFTMLLNFATRTRARLALTAATARVGRYAESLVPVRVALHPADLTAPVLHGEIKNLLAWAALHDPRPASALFD